MGRVKNILLSLELLETFEIRDSKECHNFVESLYYHQKMGRLIGLMLKTRRMPTGYIGWPSWSICGLPLYFMELKASRVRQRIPYYN